MSKNFKSLFPLLSKVQKDLSKHDDLKIGNKLLELGLEETYARLIVSNMKKHAPTLQYQLNQLNKIDDNLFTDKFERIANSIWIDNEEPTKIIEKYNINHDQFSSILEIMTNAINGLLRGDVTEKQILSDFTKNGLSQQKSETILKSIGSQKERWHPTLVFSNVQDVFFRMDKIENQNLQILKTMNEIINLLKVQKSKDKQSII